MADNKRIAKNTVFLYFRMAITMLVALYTSRVVLDVLGASDYGLYNVVGGVVTMLGFLNGSISSGTSRFISYELGVGDKERLRDIFNVALVSHIGIALIVFAIAETVGLWFVNTQLFFSDDRTIAVNIIYQLSIITTMLQFTQIPYTSDIIAHEEMAIYAYISILEVSLRLAMVFILKAARGTDMLILYGITIFVIQVIVIWIYRFYCLRRYQESHWRLVRGKRQYKQIFSFAGWDVIGSLCVLTQGQGINILLNMFFGPVVNAARAIAYQVQGAFSQFTGNFMTSVNPEIVKSYARKDYTSMVKLMNDSSIYSFFLLMVFMMPVMFKIDVLLQLWLKEVPQNTVPFTLIILAWTMIRAMARPIIMGTHATGNIKALNLYAGGLGLMPLPIAYVVLRQGATPLVVFWIILLWGVFANIAEILILRHELPEFSIKEHIKVVYLRCAAVSLLAVVTCFFLDRMFDNNILGFCLYYALAFPITCLVIFYLGLPKTIQVKITNKVQNAIRRFS